jgi:hypothetical protein
VANGPEPDGAAARSEDDDYDLLTFAEARVRLAEEIARVEAALSIATRARTPDAVQLRARLRQLLKARERNAPQRLDPAEFFDFFGYKPSSAASTEPTEH